MMEAPPSPSLPVFKEEEDVEGRKQSEAKKCRVCGDRALGYNFNAITCESCKAFFRRNALKKKEFNCPFQGECQVDQVTRRFCQKCRLRKCFDIGMKKEWIMTEEEKRKKKQKIEENRAKKITGEVGQEGDEGENSQSSNSNNNMSSNNDNDNNSDSNNNESEGNDAPVSLPTPITSASPLPAKPQAVVVGVIREGDSLPLKVARTEDRAHVHHHSQLEQVIRGNLSECSPSSALDNTNKLSDGEPCVMPPGGPPAPATLEGDHKASDPCLADMFAISIKKEVEYMDDHNQSSTSTNTHHSHHQLHHYQTHSPHHHHPYHNNQYSHDQPPPLPHPTPPHSTTPLHSHSTSPPHHTSAPHYQTSEGGGKPDDACQRFSVREAMQILHPEDKDADNSSSVMDTLMNTAIQAEYSSPLLSLHPSPPSELNEAERAKLEELTEANKGLLAPLCEDYNFKDLSNPSLINVINLTEIAIRRLIKMAKRISSFKTLCQEDQIALLKGGCTEMMILRSVCAYDPDKDSWKIQQDHSKTQDIKLKVLKAAPGNVYEEHKRFILAFEPEWRKDPHIIFLLCAITLFSPRRHHIIHADTILHEQCSYLYLTRRYLAARYNPCAGRAVYHQLLHRLAHLHRLSEEHVRLFLEVNPKQVEPLLIEIFDLKQR